MKIILKNIAKIIEADININGISIIAGNNNIGKSTILKSIYAAVNTFRNSNEKILNEHKRSLYSIIRNSDQYLLDNGYGYLPTVLLNDFYEALSKNIISLSEDKNRFKIIKKYFHEILDNYKTLLQDENIYSDEFLIPLYDKIEEVFARPKEVMMKFIGDRYIANTFSNQINFASDISPASIEIHSENGYNAITIKDHKIEELTYNSVNEPDAIYLPAYNILDIINRNYHRGTLYSPEGDIRRYLHDTSNPDKTFEEYTEIESNMETVKKILDDVVNGNLRISNSGSITYDDNDFGISVKMENVASGIKNFLLIKKLVENGFLKKNGILLIDEPETNLHPEWHLKFAEILVLMYKNMGIVTVVNSHSPYFIRSLEVMMADYGIKDKGNFYFMREKKKNRYVAENVTKKTENIYETLYKPLEIL